MNPTTDPTVRRGTTPRSAPRNTPTKPAGWVYLIHTWDDATKYVGQSSRPVWQRVNEERRTLPWGGDIKPGRDGYTILRRVDSTGDPARDAILLDLAEAEAIAQWTPSENALRPDPAVFRARLAALDRGGAGLPSWGPPATPRFTGRGTRPPTVGRGRGTTRRNPRGVPWRTVGFAVLAAAWVALAVLIFKDAPNPRTVWIVVPIAAAFGPLATVGAYRRTVHPKRRRRRRRR